MSFENKNINFIAGMPRAGTTFLYHNLQKHPQIFVPFRRKTNYFCFNYHKGDDWLYDHFKEMKASQIGFDTDTISFLNDESFNSFVDYYKRNGGKIVLLVREPASWAVSLYKKIESFTFGLISFNEYINSGYELKEDNKIVSFHVRSGGVKARIKEMQKVFGQDLLLINFDLFESNPLAVLKAIERFFDLNDYFTNSNFKNERINAGNRRSNKIVNLLLRNMFLIEFLHSFVPRKLVLFLRSLYDYSSAKNKKKKTLFDVNDLENAAQYYKEDKEFVKELFKEKDVIIST